jgi:hypothetical protein
VLGEDLDVSFAQRAVAAEDPSVALLSNWAATTADRPCPLVQGFHPKQIHHHGLAGGWMIATTADSRREFVPGVRTPTERTINPV